MATPLHKGIRDFNRPTFNTIVTYTQTQDSTTTATKCPTTFSDRFSSEYTSYSDCTKTSTATIPPVTKTSIDTTTGKTSCSTCSSTIKTYRTSTDDGTFTETIPKWRKVENKKNRFVEQAIPWHPLGICGLAKWFMADKGHPAWGVKKKIHVYDDDATEEYQGALEQTGVLEAGIETDTYKDYFSEGNIPSSVSAISNVVKVFQGMEGFINGAFLWRYNHHHPFDKGLTPLFSEIEDKWTQTVDNAIYPTDWVRVRVQGVRINEDGDIVEIALVTKYGAGANPVYAIRENSHDGSDWNNTPSVLTEPSCTLGFEGHIALVPIAHLYEFSSTLIFYFFSGQDKTDIDYDAIATTIGSNVGNTLNYPLTLAENVLAENQAQIEDYATPEKKEGLQELIDELEVPKLFPPELPYNLDEEKLKIQQELVKQEEKAEIFPAPQIHDPVGNTNTPTSSDRFKFYEYYPNIWRLNTNVAPFSSSNYPYIKAWNCNLAEQLPQIRITWYRRYTSNEKGGANGFLYINRALDPEGKRPLTYTAYQEYTWEFDEFGTDTFAYVLGHLDKVFHHDYQRASLQTLRHFNINTLAWENKTISPETEKLRFMFDAGSERLSIKGLPFNHHLDLQKNLRDNAMITFYRNSRGYDAIYVVEFPPYRIVHP